ncbi:MAG TPA: YDG domain-containing protein, partial [Moraxellaceae bacterium]|nr:YDG domain-containing protein [Moraxellaceae bacterium]
NRFSGTSTASVSNAGSITAGNGGYVALMAANVTNSGQVAAPGGNVSLAAGQQVTLTLDNGSLVGLAVDRGAVSALVSNHGLIQANGGQVLLTAEAADQLTRAVVNNDGVIEAQTVAHEGGTIRLLGDMANGSVTVAGTLDASAPDGGNGGFIETSAAQVRVADGTIVTTKSAGGTNGSWLIDPADFTIAASGGDISGATLGANLANGDVLLQSSSGTVNTSGSGSINVNDAVSWNANTLTLTAAYNVNINAVMTAGGTAGLALNPATANGSDAGVPGGTVIIGLTGTGFRGRVDFTGTGNTLSINGTPYTIISALGTQGDTGGTTLQGMVGGLTGYYALGNDIDASSTAGWNANQGFTPVGNGSTPFSGVFDGLGHTITGLTEQANSNYLGLFGNTWGGAIRNVGVTNYSISGASTVGGLVGYNGSTLSSVYGVGTVTGNGGFVGGLVGNGNGSITDAFVSDSTVSGGTSSNVGGIAGNSSGTISHAFVLNTSVTGASNVGGLVGQNGGSLQEVYTAGGMVSGSSVVGGLVGLNNGSIVDAYSTSAVSGSSATGGLIGQQGSTYVYSVPYSYWVSTGCDRYGCYGYWATGYNYYTGYNTGTVNGSFSASDLTGQSAAIGYLVSGSGTAISTTAAAMTSLSTYTGAGWSIAASSGSSAIWRIYDGSTQPLLRDFLTPVTVTPTQSLVYDAAVQGNSGSLTYSLIPDLTQIQGSPVYSGTGLNAGSYALTVSGLYSGQKGYDISYATGTLTITPATLTLSATTNTKVFDGNTSAAATVSVSGLQGADAVTGLSESYASKNVLGLNGSTLNVDGGYTVNDGNGGANYTVVTNTAAGTITPATLTLNAATNTKVYDGNTSAAATVGVSGLQGTDSVTGLTESYGSKNVLGTNGSTLSVDAGYMVNDGNVGGNYTIVTNTAAGTITPATLTLNAATNTKVYDGNTSAAATVGVSGLQGADSVTGLTESYGSKNVLGTNGSTLSVDAGYTVNDGNVGGNYTIVTNTAAGTITPVPLTVTAIDATKPLGALLPSFVATTTGFVPGEGVSNLTGSLQFLTSATKASPAGTYVVTPAGVSDSNYDITFVDGTLTIQAVPAQETSARVLATTQNPSHDRAGGFADESGPDAQGNPHVTIRNGGLRLPSDMGNQDGM